MSGEAVGAAATVVLNRWRRGSRATLGLYVQFMRLAFLKFLAYRLRYYTGVVTYTIFVAGNYFLFSALYASRPEGADAALIGGLTLAQMITYVVVSWIGRSFYFNNIDRTLSHQVVQGEIAVQLIKPLHVQTMMMSEAMGEAAFRFLMFTLPITVVVVPLFGLQTPSDPSLYGWTLLSFLLALLVNAQINFLVGCLAFRLQNIYGVIRAKMVMMEFLTGVLIPFTFFPDWVQTVVSWLPFQAISYIPVTIFLGLREGADLPAALLLQAGWASGLFLFGRWLWNRSVRQVTLQGG
ncbi:ABC-2 family transporter protein [bacterium]|nr:ABC-2 family transporter protein [bacterium]MBU1072583.1 ABC-2 family transporter protein [bacterium]MBU1675663.1 ABC-2 family transporter protein [bacterium]